MGKVMEDLTFAVANIRDNSDQHKLTKSSALLMMSEFVYLRVPGEKIPWPPK